jgi:GxxExxY protein
MITELQKYCKHVYSILGSGYSERIYHNALEVILRKNNISYETERIVPVVFEGHVIGNTRADLIVNKDIVVELKAVKRLLPGMEQQARNYLNQLGLPLALLVNFSPSQCETVVVDRCKEVDLQMSLQQPDTLCTSSQDP